QRTYDQPVSTENAAQEIHYPSQCAAAGREMPLPYRRIDGGAMTRLPAITPSRADGREQAGRRLHAAARKRAGEIERHRGRYQAVEAVHHPAMAGYHAARILDAEVTLDRGFEKVARLRHDRKHEGQSQCNPC